MNPRIIVCPYNRSLFDRISNQILVVQLNDIEQIGSVAQDVSHSCNDLRCAVINWPSSLADIQFKKEWMTVPLAIYATEMGPFRFIASQLNILQQMNLRVYLPLNNPINYTELRILSSLGIASTAVFVSKEPEWEALTDLMTYAVMNYYPHAPIDPFHYVATKFKPDGYTGFSAVYFSDPTKFLHINHAGNVSLSSDDLQCGKFILNDICELDDFEIENCPDYQEALNEWRTFFIDNRKCSICQGWRVCLGRFSQFADTSLGCENFSTEFLEILEQDKMIGQKRISLWQL